jgi:hypothetical protein
LRYHWYLRASGRGRSDFRSRLLLPESAGWRSRCGSRVPRTGRCGPCRTYSCQGGRRGRIRGPAPRLGRRVPLGASGRSSPPALAGVWRGTSARTAWCFLNPALGLRARIGTFGTEVDAGRLRRDDAGRLLGELEPCLREVVRHPCPTPPSPITTVCTHDWSCGEWLSCIVSSIGFRATPLRGTIYTCEPMGGFRKATEMTSYRRVLTGEEAANVA